MNGDPKIFGIGLSKTGTTTLNRALKVLGYSAVHNPKSFEELAPYDASDNIFVADNFEELDRSYPGSRFIYTVRDRAAWLRSFEKHWRYRHITARWRTNPIAKMLVRSLYRTESFDAESLDAAYERHDRRVRRYFQDRPGDLLVIDLCAPGDKWPVLCEFLGKPLPEAPFPHANRTPNVLVARLRDLVKPARKRSRTTRRALRRVLREKAGRIGAHLGALGRK